MQITPVTLAGTAPPSRSRGPQPREVDRADLTASAKSYYDAEADATARDAYYGKLGQQAGRLPPRAFAMRLGQLLARTHARELAYAPEKYLYDSVDRHPDGTLRDIYTGVRLEGTSVGRAAYQQAMAVAGTPAGAPSLGAALGLQALPTYNCEHVVARDWFDDRQPMRGDLHHLFTADAMRNKDRGSGLLTDDPPRSGRGAMARATLYFALRYPMKAGLSDEYLETMKAWSREDPPSDHERHRNVEIQRRQGNRNPFIDHPEWVDLI